VATGPGVPGPVASSCSRFASPELRRLADGFAIHSSILSQTFDPRLAAEIRRWFENTFFDKMRFDVVMHEVSLICRGKFFGKHSKFL